MLRLSIVLVLAACGGGGGGADTFTPSQDLAASHGYLAHSEWVGTMRVNGIDYTAGIVFGDMPAGPTDEPQYFTQAPHLGGGAAFQAGGDRVRFVATFITAQGDITTTTFDGAISGDTMSLTWRAESSLSPIDGKTGTATFVRDASPEVLGVAVWDTPDVLLVVRWVR